MSTWDQVCAVVCLLIHVVVVLRQPFDQIKVFREESVMFAGSLVVV